MGQIVRNISFRRAMHEAGLDHIELVKGRGYFYIIGADVPQTSIYVHHFSQLPVADWVREIKTLLQDE